jgi:hypothetical protein
MMSAINNMDDTILNLAKEFLQERLGVNASKYNIILFASYILRFENVVLNEVDAISRQQRRMM